MPILDTFSQLFSAFTGEQLKLLLETKHLYQKVSILPDAAIVTQLMEKEVQKGHQAHYASEIQNGLQESITLTENPAFGGMNTLQLWLPVKNVKLCCVKCDAREAFRPILYHDVTSQLRVKHKTQQTYGAETFKVRFPENFQLFALVYQCQRCESLPTAFIVKRVGTDLFLEGRSPIEHVELPGFIPKE